MDNSIAHRDEKSIDAAVYYRIRYALDLLRTVPALRFIYFMERGEWTIIPLQRIKIFRLIVHEIYLFMNACRYFHSLSLLTIRVTTRFLLPEMDVAIVIFSFRFLHRCFPILFFF